ncbi:hypothetical protein ANCCAN_09606 [Ancylostoma caninum]|uniref:Uncharacterized protein n=1 Tax=Ancylostoma caninum TaxID=29170 RepID=A0A368GJ48_ANCCA|nr:hypothetical protein ANCCAN_09606 [Ancylostoma caninum]
MRCNRALPTPGYSKKNRTNTKKVVRYCTAFMKVEYCRRHCGHEQEPALLTMDEASEAYIVSLLKDGFKYSQVLTKVGDGCKATDTTHTRLYYTTTRDIRTIAIRNKVDPARRHDVDAESVEMRVREENIDDGIRLYTPATNDADEGFVLVIITPIQKTWLEKYGSRAICVDDTFNLTPYSLRLADEWDMGYRRLTSYPIGKGVSLYA